MVVEAWTLTVKPEGLSKVNVKVAVPALSLTLISATLIVGAKSLSSIILLLLSLKQTEKK